MATVGLDRLSENCYVRVAFPIVTGIVTILLSFRDTKTREAFAISVVSALGMRVPKHIPPVEVITPLRATAILVANLTSAIILSMIAFRYPASHEGLKKHVLVFLTFAMSTGSACLLTQMRKAISIFHSMVFATLLTATDAYVWK